MNDFQQQMEQECEADVWHALQAARQGNATERDWQLIQWACGFSRQSATRNATQDFSNLPF